MPTRRNALQGTPLGAIQQVTQGSLNLGDSTQPRGTQQMNRVVRLLKELRRQLAQQKGN